MRAISGTTRHFGWGASMPAPQRSAATHAGATLEQVARSTAEGLAAAASRAMLPVARAMAAVRRWRLIHRNIRELSRLDDHLLQDIGLHRSEIVASVQRRVAEIEVTGRYPYR
jgi:uncharacterized protein YjiS (DUF1127 family)